MLALGCGGPGRPQPEGPAVAKSAAVVEEQPRIPGAPLPPLPLRTQGRWIVDADGTRFKLAAVNWYGAEEEDFVVAGLDRIDLDLLAASIREMGFNAVRLPWSNELVERNPKVDAARLSANPQLLRSDRETRALDVLDAVIAALARQGLVVVLDNHVSDAGWCCTAADGNGLWYNDRYPEASWLADWQELAQRYRDQPAVVGADLRNEPRATLEEGCSTCDSCPCATCRCLEPTWGGSDPALDWAAAAERAGEAILAANPNLLIAVEGLAYSSDFRGAWSRPIRLSRADRVVYSPHDYSWFHTGTSSEEQLRAELGQAWGFLIVQDRAFTAPLWVGEFGTCHTALSCVDDTGPDGRWFGWFGRYLASGDVDWAYWALNGTAARGGSRGVETEETFGVLDRRWSRSALSPLLEALRALQPATVLKVDGGPDRLGPR
jgi:endoglucanase